MLYVNDLSFSSFNLNSGIDLYGKKKTNEKDNQSLLRLKNKISCNKKNSYIKEKNTKKENKRIGKCSRPDGVRVSSSFIEDPWVALSCHFASWWGCCLFDTFIISILFIFVTENCFGFATLN